jgi:tetratricopeptide (TPR) repeat protein
MHARPGSFSLVVAVTAVLIAAGCTSAADPEKVRVQSMQRGEAYLDEGDLDKARVEFKNALQAAPDDADALVASGRVQERLGRIREAAELYQRAVDRQPGHAPARAELGRVFVMAGMAQKAMEIVGPGLERKPDDPRLLAVRAGARAQLRDTAGAMQDAERAYSLDAKDELVAATTAALYTANARSDKARAILEKAVKDHPKDVELRLALAQLYVSLEQKTEAAAMLRALVQLKPNDDSMRVRLAQYLVANGDAAGAGDVLRQGLALLPASATLRTALVELTRRQEGPEAAESLLKRLADEAPDDVARRIALAEYYAAPGVQDGAARARAVYEQIAASRTVSLQSRLTAKVKLGELALNGGDAKVARARADEVLAESSRNADALALRGRVLLAGGDSKGAIADLRAALRDQPSSVPVLRALAGAHIANGEPALAEEALRRALDVAADDPDSRLDLAKFLVQTNRASEGKAMLRTLAREYPANVPIQDALFKASVATDDVYTAKQAVLAILATQPDSPLGHLYAGMTAEVQRDPSAAIDHYRRAYAATPAAVEPLQALTRLLVATGRIDDALKVLDDAVAKAPNSPLALGLKGGVLLDRREFERSAAAYRAALERAPKWWIARRGLAFAGAKGDPRVALDLLARDTQPVDAPARRAVETAQLAELVGDADRAVAEYEKALAAAPNEGLARVRLATLLADRPGADSLKRASSLLAGVTNEEPMALNALGWLAFKQGDVTNAQSYLQRALNAAPSSVEILYRSAMVQLASGATSDARASLEKVASNAASPWATPARTALASLPR